MAKGAIAKDAVTKKIAAAFGSNYIGEYDKKIYVQAPENGEMVQIAISLTCPKNPIVLDATVQTTGDFNFDDDAPVTYTTSAATSAEPMEISSEERKNIADMMARLGL